MNKRKRTFGEIKDLVINRKSKGYAFMEDGDNVRKSVYEEVIDASVELSKEAFIEKYKSYLFDVLL